MKQIGQSRGVALVVWCRGAVELNAAGAQQHLDWLGWAGLPWWRGRVNGEVV